MTKNADKCVKESIRFVLIGALSLTLCWLIALLNWSPAYAAPVGHPLGGLKEAGISEPSPPERGSVPSESPSAIPQDYAAPGSPAPSPSAIPLAQASPLSRIIEEITQPTPTPTPGPGAVEPFTYRFESNLSNEFSSNVTQSSGGQQDSVLKLPIAASFSYRFPWGMQGVLGYQYQVWRYMRFKENNVSLHLGTLVVSQPLTRFANLYAGYQLIHKIADNNTGIRRLDQDLLLGLAMYHALSGDKLVYGSYQFDTLLAEVHATAFNGHSVNLGYKQVLLPNLVLSGKYRFQHRQPAESRVVATNLHDFGVELEYKPFSWVTATVRGDYILNRFAGSPQRNFNYSLLGVSLNFGLDNRTLAPVRPAPIAVPSVQPSPVPTVVPTAIPTPAPTLLPTPRPTARPIVRPRVTVKKVPARASLRQLATWYYGDENLWPIIARANRIKNPDLIQRGQKLVIPSLKQMRRPPAVRPQKKVTGLTPGVIAVVKFVPGMRLVELAERYYRKAERWRDIARFNGISNPHAIPKGTMIRIPR